MKASMPRNQHIALAGDKDYSQLPTSPFNTGR